MSSPPVAPNLARPHDRRSVRGKSCSRLRPAAAWYEWLLGAPPSFLPNDTEAVWGLTDHRYVYIAVRPGHAGHTVFVSDFIPVSPRSSSGDWSWPRATYANGVRKATFRDPDDNEIGFGGDPG